MSRIPALVIATLTATTLASAPAVANDVNSPMSMAEVVSGVVPLIPGSLESVEAFLHAPISAPQMGTFGWRHPPMDYQTRDGALLHIQLTTDPDDTKAPVVVRLLAEIDSWQCLEATKLRDEMERNEHIVWASLGPNQGWSATDKGKFLTIGQRQGRCLASVTVDVRRMPRLVHMIPRRLGDPAGTLMPAPPAH